MHSKSLWLLVVVTAGMLVWGAWLMRNSQSISQQVSIKEFLVGRDGSSFISVKPGTIITVTVEEIVHIKVKVSITDQEQEDLLFVWYTCSKGDNPARQSRGNPEWLYVAPGEPGSDCLRILIEKGDAQLDQAEIFLDIQN